MNSSDGLGSEPRHINEMIIERESLRSAINAIGQESGAEDAR